jgi:hypothetical protein
MDKLRSFGSKLSFSNLTSSSPSNKLSKAFRFNRQHNVMGRTGTGDPFKDGPIFEEVSLKPKAGEHWTDG